MKENDWRKPSQNFLIHELNEISGSNVIVLDQWSIQIGNLVLQS